MTPSTPPGDWEVVQKALVRAPRTDWTRGEEEAALAALARLRERETLNELWEARYREAEARVKELEALQTQGVFVRESINEKALARVQELEAALRRAKHELDQWVFADGTASYRVERAEQIIDRALAHEEEA